MCSLSEDKELWDMFLKDKDLVALLTKDMESCTPKEGYNLVYIDDMSRYGEQLDVIGHFDKYYEAKNAFNALAKTDEEKELFVIYPQRRRDDVEVEPDISTPCEIRTVWGHQICIKHVEHSTYISTKDD